MLPVAPTKKVLASTTAKAEVLVRLAFNKVAKETPDVATAAVQPASLSNQEIPAIIRQAYLRTLSRLPEESELQRAQHYFHESGDLAAVTRDLLWALLNTKEFLLNH